ncbi:MAG: PHP domain-containing protein [Eubacteriaceae bacterium]|nr:PHP domain-containing protein [Eubacteriaceae bacterium]
MTRADLHIHSIYSDGSDSVDELARKIFGEGLRVFSLTDHDTLSGIDPLKKALKAQVTRKEGTATEKTDNTFTKSNAPAGENAFVGITYGKEYAYIEGIEFTCQAPDGECHILGYGFDSRSGGIASTVERAAELRRKKMAQRLEHLKDAHGIILTEEELDSLSSQNSAGKPHLAKILVKRGYARDIGQAINYYINGAKVVNSRISTAEAVEAIHSSGGLAVWAHPFGGEGDKPLERKQLLSRLAHLTELGIDGMECYYSRYARERSDYLCETALQKGLLVSGGSDYHGKNKNIDIGCLSLEGKKISSDKLTILGRLLNGFEAEG